MKLKHYIISTIALATSISATAQLSNNPNKFLGNITTMGQIRSDFDTYWNQLTPENETKWESIERSRGVYDFSTAKKEYQYCKDHGFKFKFHALLWGAQIPSYLRELDANETLEAITNWFDAVAETFPDLEYIDVANEAVKGNNGTGNYHSPYQSTQIVQALGGPGESGYDWLATAFKMARERWPKAVLIYNDYNTFEYDTDEYIKVINSIKAAGGPIDAAGCQSHDLNNMSGEDFKKVLEKVHDGVQLPIFISEYDINKADDKIQETRYKEQFPIMWEAEYVAGVTLWGYIFGQTWVDDGDVKGASGLIRDGAERPALTWLREYMQTDAALNAKGPGINVSEYAFVSAKKSMVEINNTTTITGKASSEDKTIAEIAIYLNGELMKKTDKSPIELDFTPSEKGNYTFEMIVKDDKGEEMFKKTCSIKAYEPAKPYKGTPISLPGKFEAEDFDDGENGVAYSDTDNDNEGSNDYRATGVDMDKNDGDGWVIGWTNSGEWLEYTVDITKEAQMVYTARVSSGVNSSGFRMYLDGDDITGNIPVPQTGNNTWNTYTEIKGLTNKALTAGPHKLRITITGSSCNLDYLSFEEATGNEVTTQAYKNMKVTIPGIIEAENYDQARDGWVAQAYKDNSSDNEGAASFRTSEAVDIVKCSTGNALGYTQPDEWILYTVNVEAEQVYYWDAVVSSGTDGAAFRLFMDEVDITGRIDIPKTANNDWSVYKTVSGQTKVPLPEGSHVIKLVIEGANGNIDKIVFKKNTAIEAVEVSALEGVFDVYNLAGVFQCTVEINNGDTSILDEKLTRGLYIIKNKKTGIAKRVMVY